MGFHGLVTVEGRGSLVNVDGFTDLSQEPLFLSQEDLVVIQCVVMTGGRGVLHDVRVEVLSICVFSEPGAQHSGCLTNVFLVTFTILNTVYRHTLFLLLRLVLGDYKRGP